jgi:hypothetical protein
MVRTHDLLECRFRLINVRYLFFEHFVSHAFCRLVSFSI